MDLLKDLDSDTLVAFQKFNEELKSTYGKEPIIYSTTGGTHSEGSFHPLKKAVDFSVPGVVGEDNDKIGAMAEKYGFSFLNEFTHPSLVSNGPHVHIQYTPDAPINMFTKDSDISPEDFVKGMMGKISGDKTAEEEGISPEDFVKNMFNETIKPSRKESVYDYTKKLIDSAPQSKPINIPEISIKKQHPTIETPPATESKLPGIGRFFSQPSDMATEAKSNFLRSVLAKFPSDQQDQILNLISSKNNKWFSGDNDTGNIMELVDRREKYPLEVKKILDYASDPKNQTILKLSYAKSLANPGSLTGMQLLVAYPGLINLPKDQLERTLTSPFLPQGGMEHAPRRSWLGFLDYDSDGRVAEEEEIKNWKSSLVKSGKGRDWLAHNNPWWYYGTGAFKMPDSEVEKAVAEAKPSGLTRAIINAKLGNYPASIVHGLGTIIESSINLGMPEWTWNLGKKILGKVDKFGKKVFEKPIEIQKNTENIVNWVKDGIARNSSAGRSWGKLTDSLSHSDLELLGNKMTASEKVKLLNWVKTVPENRIKNVVESIKDVVRKNESVTASDIYRGHINSINGVAPVSRVKVTRTFETPSGVPFSPRNISAAKAEELEKTVPQVEKLLGKEGTEILSQAKTLGEAATAFDILGKETPQPLRMSPESLVYDKRTIDEGIKLLDDDIKFYTDQIKDSNNISRTNLLGIRQSLIKLRVERAKLIALKNSKGNLQIEGFLNKKEVEAPKSLEEALTFEPEPKLPKSNVIYKAGQVASEVPLRPASPSPKEEVLSNLKQVLSKYKEPEITIPSTAKTPVTAETPVKNIPKATGITTVSGPAKSADWIRYNLAAKSAGLNTEEASTLWKISLNKTDPAKVSTKELSELIKNAFRETPDVNIGKSAEVAAKKLEEPPSPYPGYREVKEGETFAPGREFRVGMSGGKNYVKITPEEEALANRKPLFSGPAETIIGGLTEQGKIEAYTSLESGKPLKFTGKVIELVKKDPNYNLAEDGTIIGVKHPETGKWAGTPKGAKAQVELPPAETIEPHPAVKEVSKAVDQVDTSIQSKHATLKTAEKVTGGTTKASPSPIFKAIKEAISNGNQPMYSREGKLPGHILNAGEIREAENGGIEVYDSGVKNWVKLTQNQINEIVDKVGVKPLEEAAKVAKTAESIAPKPTSTIFPLEPKAKIPVVEPTTPVPPDIYREMSPAIREEFERKLNSGKIKSVKDFVRFLSSKEVTAQPEGYVAKATKETLYDHFNKDFPKVVKLLNDTLARDPNTTITKLNVLISKLKGSDREFPISILAKELKLTPNQDTVASLLEEIKKVVVKSTSKKVAYAENVVKESLFDNLLKHPRISDTTKEWLNSDAVMSAKFTPKPAVEVKPLSSNVPKILDAAKSEEESKSSRLAQGIQNRINATTTVGKGGVKSNVAPLAETAPIKEEFGYIDVEGQPTWVKAIDERDRTIFGLKLQLESATPGTKAYKQIEEKLRVNIVGREAIVKQALGKIKSNFTPTKESVDSLKTQHKSLEMRIEELENRKDELESESAIEKIEDKIDEFTEQLESIGGKLEEAGFVQNLEGNWVKDVPENSLIQQALEKSKSGAVVLPSEVHDYLTKENLLNYKGVNFLDHILQFDYTHAPKNVKNWIEEMRQVKNLKVSAAWMPDEDDAQDELNLATELAVNIPEDLEIPYLPGEEDEDMMMAGILGIGGIA